MIYFFLLWKFMKEKAGLETCFQGGFPKQKPSCFRPGTKAGICSHSVYFLGKPHSQGIMRPSWDWVSGSSKLAQWCMTAFAFVLLCFKWDSKHQCTRPYFRHPNKQDWSSEALSAVWTDTMENAFKNLTDIHVLKYSFMLLIVKYDCYNLSFPSPGWVA